TIEKHGSKTVDIKTTKHEKTSFMIILKYLTNRIKFLSTKCSEVAGLQSWAPSGVTYRLQPLDVAINKYFKSKMSETVYQLILARCFQKPSYAILAHWCCDILVKIDKTEDDLVFDYEKLNKNLTNENNKNSELINFNNIE
ncbi:35613_t:CDS:2, partial [Racocetra persica]